AYSGSAANAARSVFTADDLFLSIPPNSSGPSPVFSEPPTDDIELTLLQEDDFQALANEDPEQFQDLIVPVALVSLPGAVGADKVVVQKCYVSYTSWQLLNLSGEAIFTMQVFSWEGDRVPKAALSFGHERWIRHVTPTANLIIADEMIYACVLREAALTGERACARKMFWRRVEQWCGQLRDRRTQNKGL
ncbi:hypothetical protein RI367_006825, partial [Sorochytrium milnesiophthora]